MDENGTDQTGALAIPQPARNRLISFYGAAAEDWIDKAPYLIQQAAWIWKLRLTGCHDRGWTSIIAHGHTTEGRPVIVKAVPDQARFHREKSALRHWNGDGASEILECDEDARLLLLPMIGSTPGGAPKPTDHEIRTALRLPILHHRAAKPQQHVPSLSRIFRDQIRPLVRESPLLKDRIGQDLIETVIRRADHAIGTPAKQVMLHGDLYADNVVFSESGHPTFIDPRGLVGPAAYDWAFWCVFYLDDGFERRLTIVDRLQAAERAVVVQWIAVIAADSLRHNLDVGDLATADRLHAILTSQPLISSIRG